MDKRSGTRNTHTTTKGHQVTRPAGMQAMGIELYEQIQKALAELKPA